MALVFVQHCDVSVCPRLIQDMLNITVIARFIIDFIHVASQPAGTNMHHHSQPAVTNIHHYSQPAGTNMHHHSQPAGTNMHPHPQPAGTNKHL